MAVHSKSLLALALWSSTLWQLLAAQDSFDPQESIPVTLTITSWSALPSTSTSSSSQLSVAGSPSSPDIPTTTTSASSTVNNSPSAPLVGTSAAGGSSLSNPASQSAAASPSSPIPGIQSSGPSTGTDNPTTLLVGTPVVGSSSASVAAVSGTASTSVTPVVVIPATASSSARAFSSNVAGLYPVIQSWIKTPDPPQATAVINAINKQDPPRDNSCKDKEQTGSLDNDTECTGFWLWKIKSNIEDTTKNDNYNKDKVKDVNNILEDKVKPEINNLGIILGKPPGINPNPPGLPDIPDLPDLPGPPSTPDSPDDPDTSSPDDPDTSNPDDPDTSNPDDPDTSNPDDPDDPDSPAPANPNEPDEPTNSPSPTPTTTSTSTTSSSTPSASTTTSRMPLCSIGCTGCGGGDAEPTSPTAPANGPRKRALPSPAPGEDPSAWFAQQMESATKLYYGTQRSAAFLMGFSDYPFQTAIANMRGCTVVVLLSKYGMYMGRLWEDPGFVTETAVKFDQNGQATSWAYPFVEETFNQWVLDSLHSGSVWGDDGNGNLGWSTGGVQSQYFTDPGAEPVALILTPYAGHRNKIMYPYQVHRIQNYLTSAIPGLPRAKVQGYRNPLASDPGIGDDMIVSSSQMAFPWGKVLVSYNKHTELQEDPEAFGGVSCMWLMAGAEVRIGDNPQEVVLGKHWEATPRQAGLLARDGAPVCSSIPSGASSGSPTAAATAGGAAGTIAGSAAASTLVTSALLPGGLPSGAVPGSTAASATPSTLVTSAVPPGGVSSGAVSSAGVPSSTSNGAGCVPTSGPDMDETKCICPDGSNSHRILPTLPSTDNLCGYDELPAPTSTAHASTTAAWSSTSTPPMTPSASTPAPTPAPTSSQYFVNKADPHNSVGNVCEGSSTSDGTVLHTTLPLDREGGCALYTTYPAPPDYPFTTTNAGGSVLAYQSSTLSYFRYGTTTNTYTFGAGPSKVLDAPTPTELFTTTDAGDTVIAYPSATLDYVNAGGAVHTYSRGAGPSTIISTPTPQAHSQAPLSMKKKAAAR
ncbi:hypothetical protein BDW62DRAFT_207218 [Aspergillus aurantiobrunneus]